RQMRRADGISAFRHPLLIAWLSLIPADGVPAPEVSDKLRHFAAYAALAAPLAVAMGTKRWLLAALLAAMYGAGMEVAQALAPTGREGSVADAAANLGGALMGAAAARLIWRRDA
ncbi:MAG: VanZ family protein, partial [Hyphomonas sp.]